MNTLNEVRSAPTFPPGERSIDVTVATIENDFYDEGDFFTFILAPWHTYRGGTFLEGHYVPIIDDDESSRRSPSRPAMRRAPKARPSSST